MLLSDVDGLYDGAPGDSQSRVLSVVTDLPDAQQQHVRDGQRGGMELSRGGMATKLEAVRIATSAGESVVIANGHRDDVLDQIFSGVDIGTLFLAEGPSVDSRKRWIGWSANPTGKLTLDAGACDAIEAKGRSLLAVGVAKVDGEFAKGDVVALCDATGREFARGLINYPAPEMRTIAGHSKEQIAELLGHQPYEVVVHRNNLVLLGAG